MDQSTVVALMYLCFELCLTKPRLDSVTSLRMKGGY